MDSRTKKKMPAGVPHILVNEGAERFAFYGMRCILTIFMTQYLLDRSGVLARYTDEQARTIFHGFVAVTYFACLLGALVSDIWLGKFRTILWFSAVNCVGLFVLALWPTQVGLYAGLGLVALGSGMIKPCVTANVGDQFTQDNQDLMARVYSWFYFAINVGATVSVLLTPELLDRMGPRIAFGAPAAAMLVATIAFWLGGRRFVHVPPAGIGFVKECLGGEGLRALAKLGFLYCFIAVFWSLYDQMDSSWVLLAERMDRIVLGYEVKSSQLSALNSVLILILIPCFSYGIYPAIGRIFPLTALRKISIGLFVTAVPFGLSMMLENRIAAGAHPSVLWMLLAHTALASAEVMVSITLLEFSYTQAPKRMKSFIMAVFYLSITLGNVFTAVVNQRIQNPDGTSRLTGAGYYGFFTLIMLVTAVLFIPAARFYKTREYVQA